MSEAVFLDTLAQKLSLEACQFVSQMVRRQGPHRSGVYKINHQGGCLIAKFSPENSSIANQAILDEAEMLDRLLGTGLGPEKVHLMDLDRPILIENFVEGTPLYQLLNEDVLGQKIPEIFDMCFSFLSPLKKLGIYHGDFNAWNILVSHHRFIALDWEDSLCGGPCEFDWFYFCWVYIWILLYGDESIPGQKIPRTKSQFLEAFSHFQEILPKFLELYQLSPKTLDLQFQAFLTQSYNTDLAPKRHNPTLAKRWLFLHNHEGGQTTFQQALDKTLTLRLMEDAYAEGDQETVFRLSEPILPSLKVLYG